jgi:hypothetical protein
VVLIVGDIGPAAVSWTRIGAGGHHWFGRGGPPVMCLTEVFRKARLELYHPERPSYQSPLDADNDFSFAPVEDPETAVSRIWELVKTRVQNAGPDASMPCCRNLLYTGITGGKRIVVMVGQKKAVAIGVRNVSGQRRRSKLDECFRPQHCFADRLLETLREVGDLNRGNLCYCFIIIRTSAIAPPAGCHLTLGVSFSTEFKSLPAA